MALSFTNADAEQMKTIERALVATLLPFKGNTEAALVVFALVRCARVMLRLYPEQTKKALLPIMTAYLEGKNQPPGEESNLLVM